MSAIDILVHLALALAAVVAVGRALRSVCRVLGQPAVVGEVVAGLLLGPSLLGAVWPSGYAFLLPVSMQPVLGTVAELGVVLYMFLVGLELDTAALEGEIASTIAIACGSVLVPFALGAALATSLHDSFAPVGVSLLDFTLFVGIAMAIVAFPVLARILAEAGLTRAPIGVRAIGAAAVSDLLIWCALAFVIGAIQARDDNVAVVALGVLGFLAVLLGARPLVHRAVHRKRDAPIPAVVFVLVVGAMLAVAWAGQQLGVHAIIAAFLVGAIIPHDSSLSRDLTRRLERGVSVVLLPAFFAFVGMRTEIGLVAGASGWLVTAVIVAVATVGKVGGTYLAARLVGRPAHEATMLGILMNTRGLMELVVLNLGLDLGVITPALFAMMVVMALATTMTTMPMLAWARSRAPGTGGDA